MICMVIDGGVAGAGDENCDHLARGARCARLLFRARRLKKLASQCQPQEALFWIFLPDLFSLNLGSSPLHLHPSLRAPRQAVEQELLSTNHPTGDTTKSRIQHDCEDWH